MHIRCGPVAMSAAAEQWHCRCDQAEHHHSTGFRPAAPPPPNPPWDHQPIPSSCRHQGASQTQHPACTQHGHTQQAL